jgi:thymidylate kinase
LREHPVLLPDISQSPTGRRLVEVFRADELFGKEHVGSTVMSHCLAAAADLFYFDGALIAPMVAAGGVVLKERHVDTLISHQAPILTRRYGWSEDRTLEWLSFVVAPLQIWPALTILVEAPLSHRERRLRERLMRV